MDGASLGPSHAHRTVVGCIKFARIHEVRSSSNNRRVVYTAVFGNYDHLPPVNLAWSCDFICFTDSRTLVSPGWKVIVCELNGESPAQANRRYKILAHEYLADYELSLYIDANIRILLDPNSLFTKYLQHGIIAIPKHQDRDCAYEEARTCIMRGLVNTEITARQMERYAINGFPKKSGMTENGIIFRNHNERAVTELMNHWWQEYCNGGRRDQLSLPYLIWKHNVAVQEVVEGPRITALYFSIQLHASDKLKSPMMRLARIANGRKHLAFHYLVISLMVSAVINLRNDIREKFLR